jgi:hypothetical protein
MGMRGKEVVGVCSGQRTKEGVTKSHVGCNHATEDMSKDCGLGRKQRPR